MDTDRMAWVMVAAVVVGSVVRLLKSDTPIPITIPPRWRAVVAMALGLLAGVMERVVGGTAWTQAIVDGLLAGGLPVVGHELVVESMRDGKEIGSGKLP